MGRNQETGRIKFGGQASYDNAAKQHRIGRGRWRAEGQEHFKSAEVHSDA
jgi:hypothetical protein